MRLGAEEGPLRLVEDVHQRIAEMVSGISHRSPEDAADIVQEMCGAAVGIVPGARYGAMTTITKKRLETVAAVGEYAAFLDEVQRLDGRGPGWAVARQRRLVLVEDLATDDRWPVYRQRALSGTPIRSQLSVPMLAEGQLLGVCSVYAAQAKAFDAQAIDIARIFAIHAALAWNTMRRKHQFQSALASRDIVGQAKGIAMERFGISAEDAFALLKQLSQQSNTPLAQIARRLARTHLAPAAPQSPPHPPPSDQLHALGQPVTGRSPEQIRAATRC